MSTETLPLDQLRFGHEAEPPINARKVGRTEEIEPLAASIMAHGLGHALTVRIIDGGYFVADGNRRLAALRLNVEKGLLPADWSVKVDTSTTGDAGELSLALNIERAPMHEADQYEKFVELNRAGMAPEDIAARFGIELARVRKMLALGALSPVILDAWRLGRFGRDSVDIVRAFTLAASIADQERVFEKLGDSNLSGYAIRREFGAADRQHGGWLELVGADVYRAAGGSVTEDLFGENHIFSDIPLLRSLLDATLAKRRQELLDAGWKWVEFNDDLPYSWTYSWQKLHGGAEASAEVKAKAGCVLRLQGHDGRLEVTYGVIKPGASKAASPGGTKTNGPVLISNAVTQRLSVQLTAAAKQAITANPKTALAAVVAGLVSRMAYGGIPVRVHAEGLLKEGRQPEDFTALFTALLAKSTDDLLAVLAAEAGFMLDMQSMNNLAPPLSKDVNRVFVEALEVDVMQAALRDRFDAADYFKSVQRVFTLKAITEALGADQARAAEKMKKGDLVAFALANVPPTGWLPPELRTAHYAGPKAELTVASRPAATSKKTRKSTKTPAREAA